MRINEFMEHLARHITEGDIVGEPIEEIYVMVDGNEFDIKAVREDGDAIRIYLDE